MRSENHRVAQARKTDYVNRMDKFANDGPLAFTLREMHGLGRSARFWAVLAGIIAILGLAGPFDSFGTMSLAERTLYWALVVVGSFALGLFVSMLTTVTAEGAGLSPPLALLLGIPTLRLRADGIDVLDEPVPADVTLHGTASDLDLVLWRRAEPGTVDLEGERAVLDGLLDVVII